MNDYRTTEAAAAACDRAQARVLGAVMALPWVLIGIAAVGVLAI